MSWRKLGADYEGEWKKVLSHNVALTLILREDDLDTMKGSVSGQRNQHGAAHR